MRLGGEGSTRLLFPDPSPRIKGERFRRSGYRVPLIVFGLGDRSDWFLRGLPEIMRFPSPTQGKNTEKYRWVPKERMCWPDTGPRGRGDLGQGGGKSMGLVQLQDIRQLHIPSS